jgi:hypothetical protein
MKKATNRRPTMETRKTGNAPTWQNANQVENKQVILRETGVTFLDLAAGYSRIAPLPVGFHQL